MASDYVAEDMDSNAGAWLLTGLGHRRCPSHWHRRRQWAGWRRRIGVVALPLLVGCAGMGTSETHISEEAPAEVLNLLALDQTVRQFDQWEVVLCRIPASTADPTFASTDQRLNVTTADIVEAIHPITEYFSRWSVGRYSMLLVPGEVVTIHEDGRESAGMIDHARRCVETALDASDDRSTGVIVVSNAAHRDDVPGGWAQPGTACEDETTRCPARRSRRVVYLGGADFFAINSGGVESVALDLLEHEIGHALGWPHSGLTRDDRVGAPGYDSAIDIMSNSAAPRAVISTRRHGPGVLAFNQLSAGWLTRSDVAVLSLPESKVVKKAVIRSPGVDTATIRHPLMVVFDLGDATALTIELIADEGDNDHLSSSGVAVHLVEWGAAMCAVPGDDNLCLGVDRRLTLHGDGSEGLLRSGQSVTVADLTVSILALGVDGMGLTAEIAVWRH